MKTSPFRIQTSKLQFPPGPPRSLRSLLIYGPGRDPLRYFVDLQRQYGDLVHVRMAGEHVFLVNDPRHVRDIFITNQRKFIKGRGLERAKRMLGQGLLTSEGETHLRQRRLMQPAFHRDRIASYASAMTAYADRVRSGWTDGATIDAAQEMMRLTLAVVGKTLFDTDVESQARDVGRALSDVLDSFWLQMLPFQNVLERLPIPALRRSQAARGRLDAIIYKMIAERRASTHDRGDLLSMLLMARDEEGGSGGMTDQQVRDEAMTIFLAGHETTANALSWTWYLLGGAPDIEAKLHEEVDRVLGGRLPGVSDIPSLPFVEKVVTEAMRLYPPAWIIGRRALEDYPIESLGPPSAFAPRASADKSGGPSRYVMPARSIVIVSPYIMHRDARHFSEPDRFHPDRWTDAFKASLPPFAYFPFGGGVRRCIGESFAWMELILVVATIAQRWKLRLVPGHPVVPRPVVTLRLKHGLKMTVHRR
jgi:cytochrome P450